MRYPLLCMMAFVFATYQPLQSTEQKSNALTVYVSNFPHQDSSYTISFEGEEECRKALLELACHLSDNPPHKIAYSIEETPAFLENTWGEFLLSITPAFSFDFDLDASPQYVSSSSFSTLPTMFGWGNPSKDPEPATEEAKPFFALRLTTKDKANISILLTDLADKSYLQLLSERNSMNRKGDRTRVVPPLRFIGYILFDPYLHRCLKTINKDSLKFKEFVNAFEERMKLDADKEDLSIYVPGFAQLLEIEESIVYDILKTGHYGNIIKRLL